MPAPIAKILIVDDEADICFFLDLNLSKRGFRTSIFHTIEQAKDGVKALKPNILLIDNHLPDGKGIEFAKQVSNKYPRMKIIMITAHDSQQDRSLAFDAGVDYFVSKPFTLQQINEIVDKVLTKT
ncbi:MAG TPA: response regulator [Chitinophagaceae bacterium]|nr:response regulator [Chitinophagaceae bacterium]